MTPDHTIPPLLSSGTFPPVGCVATLSMCVSEAAAQARPLRTFLINCIPAAVGSDLPLSFLSVHVTSFPHARAKAVFAVAAESAVRAAGREPTEAQRPRAGAEGAEKDHGGDEGKAEDHFWSQTILETGHTCAL